jgi:hypothetical protein
MTCEGGGETSASGPLRNNTFLVRDGQQPEETRVSKEELEQKNPMSTWSQQRSDQSCPLLPTPRAQHPPLTHTHTWTPPAKPKQLRCGLSPPSTPPYACIWLQIMRAIGLWTKTLKLYTSTRELLGLDSGVCVWWGG